MNIDLIRSLLSRTESEGSLKINPALPFLGITEPTADQRLRMSLAIPRDEGEEFIHWRLLADLELVRVTHDGRPGFGKSNTKVEGLTAKGREFVELSRDDHIWSSVIARCKQARALTFANVFSELRFEARDRLAALRRKDKKDKRGP